MIVRLLIAALLALTALAPATAAELVIGLGADVTSIDPHNNNAAPNNSIAEQIFNKLIENDAQQKPKPGLAESWQTIDDLTWEFKLRRGVKFHDGSEFTAADVAFSIERPGIINTPGGFTIFTRSITEKIIVDPYTIRLKTATPYPNLPIDMAGLIIVSSKAAKGAVAADFDSGKATIGTGPWKFVRYIKGDRIELVRNDNYWGPKPPWDKVTFRLITSDPSRIAALLSGDVQMIEVVPPADYANLKVNKDITIFTTTSNRMIHLHLDSNRDKSPFVTDKAGRPLDRNPFKDARVRRAFYQAIDIETIKTKVMRDMAAPTALMISPLLFSGADKLTRWPYDVAAAKQLMAEAGYPEGFELVMDCPTDRYVNDEEICQAVTAMLGRIGVKVTLNALPKAQYFEKVSPPKYDSSFNLLGWTPGSLDSWNVLANLVICRDAKGKGGTFNFGGYCNPKIDELTRKILVEQDTAKRDAMIGDAFRILHDDAGMIPLHQQALAWGVTKAMQVTQRADGHIRFAWMRKQ